MKVILLALFICFTFTSIKGMFVKKTVNVKEEAEKVKQTEEKAKSIWKALAFLTLFIIAGIYVWVSSVINTPYIIIGSAIAIVLSIYGYSKTIRQIDEGAIITEPSIEGVYSIMFNSYIVYELIRQLLI